MEDYLIKGVRIRREGLTDRAVRYLEQKFRRIRRHERRSRTLLHRLARTFLPSDWNWSQPETRMRGRSLVIGSGGGIETLSLDAVGIDNDRHMLSIARELSRNAEGRDAKFLAASAGDLPFRDSAFDCLLSDNVIEHLPDPILPRHFREAIRVLIPGGYYVMTTPNRLFENPPDLGHVSLHSMAEWEARLHEAGFIDLKTPRRRSGELVALDWKKEQEQKAFRRGRRLGISNAGLRTLTIVATRK